MRQHVNPLSKDFKTIPSRLIVLELSTEILSIPREPPNNPPPVASNDPVTKI